MNKDINIREKLDRNMIKKKSIYDAKKAESIDFTDSNSLKFGDSKRNVFKSSTSSHRGHEKLNSTNKALHVKNFEVKKSNQK